jgi:predicted GNAT family N-acyltransferase
MSRTIYRFDPAQGKVVESQNVWQEAKAGHYVQDDTMALTRSPINGKLYFDSKSALRKHYKQHGYEEVGTSYEKGVDPWEAEQADLEKQTDKRIKEQLWDRHYGRR